jgi:hypothetical protein
VSTTTGPFSPETVKILVALGIPAREYDIMDLYLAEGALIRYDLQRGVWKNVKPENQHKVSLTADDIYRMSPEESANLRQYVYAAILPTIKQVNR